MIFDFGGRYRPGADGSRPPLPFRLLCAKGTRKDFLHLILTDKVNCRPAAGSTFRVTFGKAALRTVLSLPCAASRSLSSTLPISVRLTVLVILVIHPINTAVRQTPPGFQRRLQMHVLLHPIPLHHKSRPNGHRTPELHGFSVSCSAS